MDPFRLPLDHPNAKGKSREPARNSIGEFPRDPDETLDVRGLRERMRLTQRQFAGWFGFPLATLKHWERGSRQPTGSALVKLLVINENPRIVRSAVRKARRQRPGLLPGIQPAKSYRAPPDFGERLPARRPRGPRRAKAG